MNIKKEYAALSSSLKIAWICFGLILFWAVMSLIWTPQNPHTLNLANRFAPFSSLHWLGTDHFGRDLASLLMQGLKNSLLVAVTAVIFGAVTGITLGFVAALTHLRGLDFLMRKVTDFMFIFPALLTAILLAALYGPSLRNTVLAISIFNVPVFFRLSRDLAHAFQAEDYIRAARALGQTRTGLVLHHLLPASAGVLLTQVSIQLGLAILAEAALSYLGLGIPQPLPSLGRMLQDAQTYMMVEPQLAVLPGGVIAVCVFTFNLFGDGLRDMLDSRRMQTF